jgi:translocator protein
VDTLRQVSNVLALIVVLVVNYLANALPLGGRTPGEIADLFPVYFIPAGYVFSIWSVIYLLLVGFTIYQVLPAQRDNPLLRRLGFLFVLSSAANVGWLFAWHYGFYPLSLVIMLALLLTLIFIYLRLGIGKTGVSGADRWLVHLPFSIYLGWITVATVSNASVVLYDLGWDGWGLGFEAWTVIMLLAAAAIGAAVGLTRRDAAFNLVLVWAFIGIFVDHRDVTVVAAGAFVAAALAAAFAVLALRRPPKPRPARP